MRNFQKIFIIISFVVVFFITNFSVAHATQIYFDPDFGRFGKTDQFEIKLLIDTKENIINAMETEIVYPTDLLRLIDVNGSNSVVSMWIEKRIDEKLGKIFLSGIMPGGFDGILKPFTSKKYPGEMISLTFESLQQGSGFVSMHNTKILLHDGLGSQTDISTSSFSFDVMGYIGDREIYAQEDKTPPEEFEIIISKDEFVFGGKYFLVFNTQDKGSGVEYYEVKEGNMGFEVSESPHVLRNQKLYNDVVVRVVDKSGNKREVKLTATNKKPFYLTNWFWVVFVVTSLLIWINRKKV